MSILKHLIPAALALCLVAGCSGGSTEGTTTGGASGSSATKEPAKPSSPMAGAWKLEVSPEAMKDAPKDTKPPEMTMTFTEDGKFMAEMKFGETTSKAEGTFKLDGKSLTIDTVTEDGKPSKSKDETVTLSDDMKSFPIPGSEGMGKMVKQ